MGGPKWPVEVPKVERCGPHSGGIFLRGTRGTSLRRVSRPLRGLGPLGLCLPGARGLGVLPEKSPSLGCAPKIGGRLGFYVFPTQGEA
jgi:hypothetical protein